MKLKKILKDISLILTLRERSRMIRLIFMDLLVSLLDIGFLIGLIYVIHFYSAGSRALPFSFFPFSFFERYPLSLILVFFVAFAVKNWLAYLVFRAQQKFVFGVASRLSKANLFRFLNGPYDAHVHINSAVHINKISRHPVEFAQHILANVQQIAGQCILIIMTTTAILIYNPILFLLLFIILIPPIIIMGVFIKKRLNEVRKTAKPVHEKTLQHLQEGLSGYIESNVYNRIDFFINRYSFYQSRFNNFLSQQIIIQNLPYRFMEVFALFGLTLLIIINFYHSNTGGLEIVTIGTFMAAAYKIIPGFVKILNSSGQIKTHSYSIKSLLEGRAITATKDEAPSKIDSVSLKNISFSYKEKKVLNDVSMTFKNGDLIGLTGISGRGKTTLINLLLGFLDQQSGDVIINNKSTTAMDRALYRKRISYVKQDLFLIHDSIITNITLEEQPADQQRLQNAIEATGLNTLISAHPEGFDNLISENGRNISGGQKQRIAIARALYKDADLIILDEPFNELDRPSEDKLLQHFRTLALEGKIIILITHNKESVANCSKIISLDEN